MCNGEVLRARLEGKNLGRLLVAALDMQRNECLLTKALLKRRTVGGMIILPFEQTSRRCPGPIQ